MNIYLEYVTETENRAIVNFIHYYPFDEVDGLGKTAEELGQTGILVESVPQETIQPGKLSVLYVNPQTKELWYEYIDVPLSAEERIAQLEKENAELRKVNLDTQEAVLELYEMIMNPQS